MKGVLVTGHDLLPNGLLSACDLIMGHHDHCRSVSLTEGVDSFTTLLYETLDQMFQEYEAVIVLADLKGGTPFNQCYRYKLERARSNMEIISGMNLPLLMELVLRLEGEEPTEQLVEEAVRAGQPLILKDDEDDR